MTPKIFVTGPTGYVGGDFLFLLLQTHSDWAQSISCLVRDKARGQSLEASFPDLRLVYGSLDDTELLETEAAKADIVLHFASSDHVGAAEAIAKGLKRGSGGHWIHTSGTDILLLQEGEEHTGPKIINDWDGVEECINRPNSAPHRLVDKVILDSASSTVKTAIVCPSLIYGAGRGSGNKRSMQAYEMCRMILERGQGYNVGEADYMWFDIHVYDLSRLYVLLVEAAVAGDVGVSWDRDSYYLVENGEHRWNDLAESLTREAYRQKFISSEEMDAIDSTNLDVIGMALWNISSRAKAIRARELLGWKPRERSLLQEVPSIVFSEATRLDMKPL